MLNIKKFMMVVLSLALLSGVSLVSVESHAGENTEADSRAGAGNK